MYSRKYTPVNSSAFHRQYKIDIRNRTGDGSNGCRDLQAALCGGLVGDRFCHLRGPRGSFAGPHLEGSAAAGLSPGAPRAVGAAERVHGAHVGFGLDQCVERGVFGF